MILFVRLEFILFFFSRFFFATVNTVRLKTPTLLIIMVLNSKHRHWAPSENYFLSEMTECENRYGLRKWPLNVWIVLVSGLIEWTKQYSQILLPGTDTWLRLVCNSLWKMCAKRQLSTQLEIIFNNNFIDRIYTDFPLFNWV